MRTAHSLHLFPSLPDPHLMLIGLVSFEWHGQNEFNDTAILV